MTNISPYRKLEAELVTGVPKTDTEINIGDHCLFEGGLLVPVNSMIDQGSISLNRQYASSIYIGIADQQSPKGQNQPIQIRINGDFEFPCDAPELNLFTAVTFAEAENGKLDNKKVEVTSDPNLAIGISSKVVNPVKKVQWCTLQSQASNFLTDQRMNWTGSYEASKSYQANDVTVSQGWLMVANTLTTDPPHPVPSGTAAWMVNGQTFLTPTNQSVVQSGFEIEFTEGGYWQSIRVWAPELTDDTNYQIVITNITNPAAPKVEIITSPILTENAWSIVALNALAVKTGSKYRVVLDALNSGSSTPVVGGWRYEGVNNNADPALSGWNRRSENNIIRLSSTDLDSTDRTSELEGVIPGSTVQIAQTSDPSRAYFYTVRSNGGVVTGVVDYEVTLDNTTGGGPDILEPCTITIDVPVPQPTKYVEDAGYWTTGQPAFGTVTGYLAFDGVEQSVDDNAYGVDLYFQPAEISLDWDVMAVTDGTAGSPAAGGSFDLGATIASVPQLTPETGDLFIYYDASTSTVKAVDALELLNIAHLDEQFDLLPSNQPFAEDQFMFQDADDGFLKRGNIERILGRRFFVYDDPYPLSNTASTNSTSWSNAQTFNKIFDVGDYLLSWKWENGPSAAGRACDSRISFDGLVVGENTINHKDIGGAFELASGMILLTNVTAGNHEIKIEFRKNPVAGGGGGVFANIKNWRWFAEKVIT